MHVAKGCPSSTSNSQFCTLSTSSTYRWHLGLAASGALWLLVQLLWQLLQYVLHQAQGGLQAKKVGRQGLRKAPTLEAARAS
jgi:hypothetical protein